MLPVKKPSRLTSCRTVKEVPEAMSTTVPEPVPAIHMLVAFSPQRAWKFRIVWLAVMLNCGALRPGR